MTAANALNIPSIGPISNTANGTFTSAYNKFYSPDYANIGIALSAGTFTVLSEDGSTAFSSTNPGLIALPSLVTPGKTIRYSVTSNQTFVDHSGTSTIDGNLFGFTTGDVQSTDVPFFLYAVGNSAASSNKETTISFMISRQAGRRISPVAGSIGKTGSAIATDEFAFFALGTPTVADYASSPCKMIGSFRMTKVSASDGWVVSTLNSQDGINQFQDQVQFSLSTGVMGAKAGSWWINNGGTAPTFNTQSYNYYVLSNGYINSYMTGLTTSVNGAGAVNAQMVTVMRGAYLNGSPAQTSGRLVTVASNALVPAINNTTHMATFIFVDSAADGALTNAILGATVVDIEVNLFYYPRVS